jgi:hypothetical protein
MKSPLVFLVFFIVSGINSYQEEDFVLPGDQEGILAANNELIPSSISFSSSKERNQSILLAQDDNKHDGKKRKPSSFSKKKIKNKKSFVYKNVDDSFLMYHHHYFPHLLYHPHPHHLYHHHHHHPPLLLHHDHQLLNVPEPDYKLFKPLPRKKSNSNNKVRDMFFAANIVQDLGISAPKSLLRVRFPNKAVVCLGNHLSFIDSMLEPSIEWTPSSSSKYFTTLALDPDLLLTTGQFVHLLRVNGISSAKAGTTVMPYLQPLAVLPGISSPASPYHRYVFLVFSHQKPLDPLRVKEFVTKSLFSFKVSEFVRSFDLDSTPVAGNFFYGRLYVTRKVVC